MDPRTFAELVVEPGMATATRAEEHIQMALQLTGFPYSVWNRVQRHTAKRRGMRILNGYVGPAEMKEGDKMFILHHRAIGRHKSAGAYN